MIAGQEKLQDAAEYQAGIQAAFFKMSKNSGTENTAFEF